MENVHRVVLLHVVGDEVRLHAAQHHLAPGYERIPRELDYLWCEDAVACAALRRQILAELVPHWLGPRASVATAYGHHWNEVTLSDFAYDSEYADPRGTVELGVLTADGSRTTVGC